MSIIDQAVKLRDEAPNFGASLGLALTITRRELRDQFRDWRILAPMVILTLVFPGIMQFTSERAINWVSQYNAPIVAERLFPFLLMIVGFFPLSVSLIIALESFVGEKERHSIEPLLCSPLSDAQLYFGKLMASMVLPLLASYLGITVYLAGLYLTVGWFPELRLLVQVLLLTTIQAVVMVAGAVVVSSQTTSVRAANLLSSFIIIPMTFLIQGESIVMFWAIHSVLWWIIIALVVIAGLLVRTGLAYFNREEMLGRELDQLNLRLYWQIFKRAFKGRAANPAEWYRYEVTAALRAVRPAIAVMAIALLIGVWAGTQIAEDFRVPAGLLRFDQIDRGFVRGLEAMRFFTPTAVITIWLHNLRSIALASILGIFSFGVLAILVLMLPIALIAYIAANVAMAGGSWPEFVMGLVAPHGILEIPAILIAGGAIVRLGAVLTAPAEGRTLGEAFMEALARWAQILLGVVLPLFLLAAVVESLVTPHVAVWIMGR